jgi:murein DD-endopeptidase MepM/ murein hydrolase activator NlpD
MNIWPVPQSVGRFLPMPGSQGSFWEDRGDRHHAGIDLYAPAGSDVVATEAGTIIEVQEFTSPKLLAYWNITYSVLIKTNMGKILRFAEMEDAIVKPGEKVIAGQCIGHVGMVLNPEKIDSSSPVYIQRLKKEKRPSMLHFELHNQKPSTESYLGGNYFITEKPIGLLDPTPYLQSLLEE